MTKKLNIPSRETGLRYEIESARGVLPGSPVWKQMEPRSYPTPLGRENIKERPSPIVPDRMARKSAVVSFRNNAGIEIEVKPSPEFFDFMRVAMFAAVRAKREVSVTAVTEDGGDYSLTVASGGGDYDDGDLIFVQGMDDAANNGLFVVEAGATGTSIPVAGTLTTAATQTGTGRLVGHEFTAGDLEINSDGNLVTTAKDLTELPLLNGEFLLLGGDEDDTFFATAGNNTMLRADAISENLIETAKPLGALETDAGAGKTIRIFFASQVLKNESNPAEIVESWIQLEQRMGAPDTAEPGEVQYQYHEGGSVSEVSISLPQSGLVTATFTFMGSGHTMRDAADGPKAGDRPATDLVDPFNTANNVVRSRLGIHDGESIVQVMSNMTLSINNNMSVLDGYGQPAFGTNEGEFGVSGSSEWFFQDFEAAKAVEGNLTGTYDTQLFRDGAGISIDMPALDLEGGVANPVADNAITVPISITGINGRHARPELDHALMVSKWEYIPQRHLPAQQT